VIRKLAYLAASAVALIGSTCAASAMAASASSPAPAVLSASSVPPGLVVPGSSASGYSGAGVVSAADLPDATSNYEYSSTFVPESDLTTTTSGSVNMTIAEQGTRESDAQWQGNHSLSNFVVWGSCAAGNTSCTANPLLEITSTTGQDYCAAAVNPCFQVYSWKNSAETFDDGYVEAPGGIPDNGTFHPPLGSAYDIGYSLDNTNERIDITLNGRVVGWFPDSYWGQTTFGPITQESVQTEVYEGNPDWTTDPLPSMDYTFSDFTDSSGNTLPAPAVSTPYSVSNESGTGYTSSGGLTPIDAGTYWAIEVDADSGNCVANLDNTKANLNPQVLQACTTPGEAQNWRWNPSNGEIVNQDGDCLADPNDSTTNNTDLELYACNSSAGETWTPSSPESHDFLAWSVPGGMCLTDPGGSDVGGTKLVVYSCNGNGDQLQDAPTFTNP
jgi:hypothetical protein